MDVVERLFLTLVELELRKGAALADAANEAKFRMGRDLDHFNQVLAELKGTPAAKAAKKAE